jgi:hypothetical protein
MGKWAKGHFKAKRRGLTPKAMKGLVGDLKDDITPDVPGESAEERNMRDRQATELARLDDEENRRIKGMFAAGGARKLFRAARTSRPSRAASSPSSTPGTGVGSATGGRPVYSGRPGSMIP